MAESTNVRQLTNGVRVAWPEGGMTVVTLSDGREVIGSPQGSAEQAETAARLGYHSPAGMVDDHDPLHAWLAAALGLPDSPALKAAAGDKVDPVLAGLEEAAVLAVQAYARAVGVGARAIIART